MKERIELAVIGAIAGVSLWVLFEILPDVIAAPFLLFFTLCTASVFFAVLMALIGPERPLRALWPSAALAGLAGLLGLWAARRFEHPEAFIDTGHGLIALFTLVFVATPFAAAALEERQGWKSYARLFDAAWGVFIRYTAGWLFTGLIFLALFLSDALLKLVGIEIIEDLLDIELIRYTLVGAVFGVGVATVHELRGYVSPVLVHRLLRMLLPLLLFVVAVFIAALPFRGLSELFGRFSTAAVLMSVAFAGITLITTALDRDDDNASHLKLMVWSARAMALLLPVLVGLAVYAIWLRVAAYGWTPDRVIAAFIALMLMGYAGVYSLSAVRGRGWQAALRQGNLYMALAICASAALWLTPLLNAERISAQSQLARAEDGAKPEDLPLYLMAHDWGVAGTAALDEMALIGDETLTQQIEKAKAGGSRWAYQRDLEGGRETGLKQNLPERFLLRPEDFELAALLEDMPRSTLEALDRNCPKGQAPSCIFVELPEGDMGRSAKAIVVSQEGRRALALALTLVNAQIVTRNVYAYDAEGRSGALPSDLMARLRAGDFEFKPVVQMGLDVGGMVLLPNN